MKVIQTDIKMYSSVVYTIVQKFERNRRTNIWTQADAKYVC